MAAVADHADAWDEPAKAGIDLRSRLADIAVDAALNVDAIQRNGAPLERAGTTFTVVALGTEQTVLHHLGDSRVYRIDDDGTSTLASEDHTIVARLAREGILDEAEAAASPLRGRLYRYLGAKDATPFVASWPTRRGDRILMTTDGCLDIGREISSWNGDGVDAIIARLFRTSSELVESDDATAIAIMVA